MIHTLSPDLQQAVHMFFADQLFNLREGSPVYRIGMDEIKREFRKKALQYHPDRAEFLGKSRGLLEEQFKRINNAYGLLKSAVDDDYLILRPSPKPAATPRPTPDRGATRKRKTYDRPDRSARYRQNTANNDHSRNNERFRQNRRKPYFFGGMMPRRELRFGEYLFYKRIIAWRTLIDAIVWQHRVRPRLGQIALDLDYLGHQDIMNILKNKNYKEPFGQAAVRLGYLDSYRRFVLLGRQRSYNLPLGRYFLDYNILTESSLALHIRENKLHNLHFTNRFQGM